MFVLYVCFTNKCYEATPSFNSERIVLLTVQVVLYHFSERRIEIEEHETQKQYQYILNIHQTNTVKDSGIKITQYVSDTKETSTQENPILIIGAKQYGLKNKHKFSSHHG